VARLLRQNLKILHGYAICIRDSPRFVSGSRRKSLQQARDGRSTRASFCAAAPVVVLAFACIMRRCIAHTFIDISRQPTICQGAGQGAVDSDADAAAGGRGSASDCAACGNPERAWSAASLCILHLRFPVQPASPACSSLWRRARRALQQCGRGTARDSLQRAGD
jgi:hypothetical protein